MSRVVFKEIFISGLDKQYAGMVISLVLDKDTQNHPRVRYADNAAKINMYHRLWLIAA